MLRESARFLNKAVFIVTLATVSSAFPMSLATWDVGEAVQMPLEEGSSEFTMQNE